MIQGESNEQLCVSGALQSSSLVMNRINKRCNDLLTMGGWVGGWVNESLYVLYGR